ncbi:MAG TPA: SDR family oxidoreductase [Hyphomicrobiaceae bacterium]|nr:SDR family oxidoreductase [Hyphomicrobiaceae bacterium]
MSVFEDIIEATEHPELAGKRVLVTGLTMALGVDVARAFAEHRARLVLHIAEDGPEADALASYVSSTALDLELYSGAIGDKDAATKLAQRASTAFGPLDVIVNLAVIATPRTGDAATEAEIEDAVSSGLRAPLVVTRIAANRMRLTMTGGLILNVAIVTGPDSKARRAVAAVTRTTLAAMTRAEAASCAADGIRINAIAPRSGLFEHERHLQNEPQIANVALYLASKKGREHTGLVFEANGPQCR